MPPQAHAAVGRLQARPSNAFDGNIMARLGMHLSSPLRLRNCCSSRGVMSIPVGLPWPR